MGYYEPLAPGSLPYAHVTETKYCGVFAKNPQLNAAARSSERFPKTPKPSADVSMKNVKSNSVWIAACDSCGKLGNAHNPESGRNPTDHFKNAGDARRCGQFTRYPRKIPDGISIDGLFAGMNTSPPFKGDGGCRGMKIVMRQYDCFYSLILLLMFQSGLRLALGVGKGESMSHWHPDRCHTPT
jgi:hypothetical protein